MLLTFAGFAMGLAVMTLPASQGADFPSDLGQWFVTDPPKISSDQWHAANADVDHEWVVTPGKSGPQVKRGGRLLDNPSSLPFEIKPARAEQGLAGRRITTRVDDGWIVGFNAGEFGAGLWWFSPDGERRYRISEDHVNSFVPTSSGLLTLEGLAHGSMSKGRVARLSRDGNGRWLTEALVDLGHAPYAAVKDVDGSLIVATTNRLLRIDPASKKTVVMLDHVFWRSLYPNSIVVAPSGTIFVGMRHGVAKVEKKETSYKVSWLLPDKKFADDKGPHGLK
jgi:hypothetical protein